MSVSDRSPIKDRIEFTSSYPDDTESSEEGDFVTPGGRIILEAYRAWLAERGIESTPVEHHSHYGLYIDSQIDGGKVWHMIQFCDPWLMIIRPIALRIPFLNATKIDQRHRRACELFQEFLQADPKLELQATYTQREFEQHEKAQAEARAS